MTTDTHTPTPPDPSAADGLQANARVTQALGRPFLTNVDGTLHLGGDWCIGARVEAAWQSGTAIADDILARA